MRTSRGIGRDFKHRLLIMAIGILALSAGSCTSVDYSEQVEQHRRMAGELQNNRLYGAAVEEYRAILSYNGVDTPTRANINYLIARLYFENLKDYENAAAYYVRAKELDPEGSFATQATKNLVASLEKLGNVIDAKRQLDEATDIDNTPREPGDIAVAQIGDRSIWLSDIDA
ncbi:MAG: hypothetical protein KKA42_03615, partial [candidate division Zixibacteria bacterium]|nr:hypothetical protein [candidate division Zixibacteria bacterium]